MSRRWGRTAIATVAVLSCALPAPLAAEQLRTNREHDRLIAEMREVRALQERSIIGDGSAHREHLRRIGDLSERLERGLSSDIPASTRLVRAAACVALLGGRFDFLKRFAGMVKPESGEAKLVAAALALGEGRREEAERLFGDLEPLRLEPELGGIVALVRGILAERADPAAAIAQLSRARLLATGTHIEEAALRREAFLVGTGDLRGFERLATRYLRSYARSLYAPSFVARLIVFAAHGERGALPVASERAAAVKRVLNLLPAEQRKRILLAITAESLAEGSFIAARATTQQLADQASLSHHERTRLSLYRGAADILGDEPRVAIERLKTIPRDALIKADLDLLEMVQALGAEVVKPPRGVVMGPLVPSATLVRAEQSIRATDAELAGVEP